MGDATAPGQARAVVATVGVGGDDALAFEGAAGAVDGTSGRLAAVLGVQGDALTVALTAAPLDPASGRAAAQ